MAYANALSSGKSAPEGTDKRLEDIQKSVRFQDQVHPDSITLQGLRTTKIQWKVTSYQSAEFFVLFGAEGKVSDVKFVSGSEQLREAAKAISAAHFDVAFPDDNPRRSCDEAFLAAAIHPRPTIASSSCTQYRTLTQWNKSPALLASACTAVRPCV